MSPSSNKKITWTTERVKLGDLVEWESNPVQLSKHDFEQIKISLEKFGLVLPLVANRPKMKRSVKRRLIDGHQRKTIMVYAEMAGLDTEFDVRVPSRKLTDRECDELSIRLRKNTGDFDFDILANIFQVDDLLDWGFQGYELGLDGEDIDFDEAWEGMPEFEQEHQLGIKDIIIHFNTQEDIDEFSRLVNQKITAKTKYIWFPKQEKMKSVNVEYINES